MVLAESAFPWFYATKDYDYCRTFVRYSLTWRFQEKLNNCRWWLDRISIKLAQIVTVRKFRIVHAVNSRQLFKFGSGISDLCGLHWWERYQLWNAGWEYLIDVENDGGIVWCWTFHHQWVYQKDLFWRRADRVSNYSEIPNSSDRGNSAGQQQSESL